MKKKDGNKFFWCYFGLFILVVLLLLPLGLKLFGKNLYEKKEIKKDEVIEVLNCNKDNATISSTFLNGIPQNLLLKIKGDYYSMKESDNSDNALSLNSIINDEEGLIKYIRNYSEINYSEQDNMTSFKVDMNSLKQIDEYVALFNNLEKQQRYYVSQAFSCTVVKY